MKKLLFLVFFVFIIYSCSFTTNEEEVSKTWYQEQANDLENNLSWELLNNNLKNEIQGAEKINDERELSFPEKIKEEYPDVDIGKLEKLELKSYIVFMDEDFIYELGASHLENPEIKRIDMKKETLVEDFWNNLLFKREWLKGLIYYNDKLIDNFDYYSFGEIVLDDENKNDSFIYLHKVQNVFYVWGILIDKETNKYYIFDGAQRNFLKRKNFLYIINHDIKGCDSIVRIDKFWQKERIFEAKLLDKEDWVWKWWGDSGPERCDIRIHSFEIDDHLINYYYIEIGESVMKEKSIKIP